MRPRASVKSIGWGRLAPFTVTVLVSLIHERVRSPLLGYAHNHKIECHRGRLKEYRLGIRFYIDLYHPS